MLFRSGQLTSKARFLAAPWIGMLEGGAWQARAAHANAMARRLAAAMPFPITHLAQGASHRRADPGQPWHADRRGQVGDARKGEGAEAGCFDPALYQSHGPVA